VIIHGPGVPKGRNLQPGEETVQTDAGRVKGAVGGQETAARKAALFIDRGVDLRPAEITALEAELAARGIAISDLDGESALRAVLLRRHGVPLDRTVITDAWHDEPAVAEHAAALREAARSLLSRQGLPADMRNAAGELLQSLEGLFAGTGTADAATTAVQLDRTLAVWIVSVERGLAGLAGADAPVTAPPDGASAGIDLPGLLGADIPGTHPLAQVIRGLRSAVQEVRERLLGLQASGAVKADALRQILGDLAARLGEAAGGYRASTVSAGVVPGATAAIAGFLDDQVRKLGLRLSLLTSGGEGTISLADIFRGGDAPGIRSLVMKSGMLFEWKLLAWYRSGGNPSTLRALLAHDMKGILLEFFRKTRGRRTGGTAGRALGDLEDTARSLFDAVTKRQLSTVLNSRGDRQVLRFELPFGDAFTRDRAALTVRGDKDQSGGEIGPETGSIEFSLKTDALGTVDVLMRFRGREQISLGFVFDDEAQRSLAGELSEEMRQSFADSGYTVHSISFGVRGDDDEEYDVGSASQKRGGVDLTG